jgi:hypothetical protein
VGIKGSNSEPRTQIRWREKSVRSGIVPHDSTAATSTAPSTTSPQNAQRRQAE